MPDSDQRRHQTQAFLELTNIIQTQKIPNALLFTGSDNSQKKDAALFFAKSCNCLEKSNIACNTCKSCHKIDAQSHPDILTIDLEKDKKNISIAQIRKMGSAISSRPNEARYRMVLILNSDKMNPQAQNALLKMLEEPPEKTFFILIARDTSLLLPTIISRCLKIRFKPLDPEQLELSLVNDFKIDSKMAYIAARTADSNLKKAMIYLNLDPDEKPVEKTEKINWIKKRKYLLKTIIEIIKADTNKSTSKGLMLSQKISSDKGMIDNTIAIMTTFFRDLMIFRYDRKQIINLDFSDAFKDINSMVESYLFFDWLEDLFETQKRVASNNAPRIVLDRFFLKIAQQAGTKC